MWNRVRRMAGVAVFGWVCSTTSSLWAVAPNALESAYWRFEEGTNGGAVPDPVADPDGDGTPYGDGDYDAVVDSINNNNLRKATGTGLGTPTYTGDVAPTPLKSGQPNNLAMSFSPNSALITSLRNIENGIIEPGNGFTIEAAFRPNAVSYPGGPYRGILAKGGEPDDTNPHAIFGNLPTAALKVRGDSGVLMFEQYDTNKNLVNVSSVNPLVSNNWYYAAVVNDGSTLSLYLDSNDGNGYQLQSSTIVSGAMYMGDPNNPDPEYVWPDWSAGWSVGRGYFAGANDYFDGTIDEVRITNSALDPEDFLFAPGLDGDFNDDQIVDAADYVVWRKLMSTDPDAYQAWRRSFGMSAQGGGSSVPEPASVILLAIATMAGVGLRTRS